MDDVDRELWEIAENLHRVELTKEQRDEHIRRYAELIEQREEVSRQTVAKMAEPKRGRPQGIASKVAEETGLSVRTVQRVLAPEQPKPQPKPAAPLNDIETTDKQVARLMSAWNAGWLLTFIWYKRHAKPDGVSAKQESAEQFERDETARPYQQHYPSVGNEAVAVHRRLSRDSNLLR